jgi:hypothetical protein
MLEDGKTRSGRRERRSKVRLSDVHRLVDTVVDKHMPGKTGKSKPHHEATHHESERRGGGHHKK